jgi:hypothetical protein
MDCRICQRMCYMPTKQNPHTLKENTSVSYPLWTRDTTILECINRPNYRSFTTLRTQCNPNYCRPRMLVSCPLPSLCYDDHRTRNCPTILRSYGTMVQDAQENNQWLRPLIHISLWMSTSNQTQYLAKPVHGIPSTDWQPIRIKEPMGRTISPTLNLSSAWRLGSVANDSVCSP